MWIYFAGCVVLGVLGILLGDETGATVAYLFSGGFLTLAAVFLAFSVNDARTLRSKKRAGKPKVGRSYLKTRPVVSRFECQWCDKDVEKGVRARIKIPGEPMVEVYVCWDCFMEILGEATDDEEGGESHEDS